LFPLFGSEVVTYVIAFTVIFMPLTLFALVLRRLSGERPKRD
jgi:hypothetical protein